MVISFVLRNCKFHDPIIVIIIAMIISIVFIVITSITMFIFVIIYIYIHKIAMNLLYHYCWWLYH